MKFEYPVKIILAWGEAIGGNREIRDWLTANGYPELGLFIFAMHHKKDARQWLMENGFPHLVALINGAEGNPNALMWLRKHGLEILEKMARAADNDDEAVSWMYTNDMPDLAVVSLKMRHIKNEIERDNNDPHKISAD